MGQKIAAQLAAFRGLTQRAEAKRASNHHAHPAQRPVDFSPSPYRSPPSKVWLDSTHRRTIAAFLVEFKAFSSCITAAHAAPPCHCSLCLIKVEGYRQIAAEQDVLYNTTAVVLSVSQLRWARLYLTMTISWQSRRWLRWCFSCSSSSLPSPSSSTRYYYANRLLRNSCILPLCGTWVGGWVCGGMWVEWLY